MTDHDQKSDLTYYGKIRQEAQLEGKLEGEKEGKIEGKLEGKKEAAREALLDFCDFLAIPVPPAQRSELLQMELEALKALRDYIKRERRCPTR